MKNIFRSGRWKDAVRRISQGVAAGALMVGGVIFTLDHHTELTFGKPGRLFELPGMVVEATKPSEEEFKISQVLRRYTKNEDRADRIASALVKEGQDNKIDPVLLVGVLLTENAQLNPTARSNVGAKGLMQVMPFHRGKWGCESTDLASIEGNICHGVRILADNIRNSRNTSTALLKYNGCVKGTNTPNCHTYPRKVLAFANQTEKRMAAVKVPESLEK